MNILAILVIIVSILVTRLGNSGESVQPSGSLVIVPTLRPTTQLLPTVTPTLSPLRSVFIEVPFTSQAPFGEWSDKRQQDGCEETAAFMGVFWAQGLRQNMESPSRIAKQYAKDEIIAAYEYQVTHFGSGIDTSTFDTQERIIRGYFNFHNTEVVEVVDINQIVRILMSGSIVIVPTNGRLLFNPNFTNGGPDRHNLVIKGYDLTARQFITNDPGTRQGENYRYDEKVLFTAIRDYETGDHEPIVGVTKRMIVVHKLTN